MMTEIPLPRDLRRVVQMALAVVVLSARTAVAAGEPPKLDPDLVARGHDVFVQKRCGVCHGVDGKGVVNLADRNTGSLADAIAVISDGRDGARMRMPGWKGVLTDAEINSVATFVLSLQAPAR